MAPTLTRSVHLREMCLSEAVYWQVLSRRWKCREQLSSDVIIYITSENITALKNGIEICLCICHLVSETWRSVTWWQLESAGLFSKTVHFNVLKVSKGTGTKKSFKKFWNLSSLKWLKFSNHIKKKWQPSWLLGKPVTPTYRQIGKCPYRLSGG